MAFNASYTTTDLCGLLSLTRKAVLDRAKREGWQSRPRKGRGSGQNVSHTLLGHGHSEPVLKGMRNVGVPESLLFDPHRKEDHQ